MTVDQTCTRKELGKKADVGKGLSVGEHGVCVKLHIGLILLEWGPCLKTWQEVKAKQ